jgi:HEAT repeat protein
MKIKHVIVFILIIMLNIPLTAQDNNEKEIEEIYLKNPELRVIREEVLSSDFQTKLNALDSIQSMVKQGNVNTEVENLVILLGDEGTASKKYSGNIVINNFPEVRRKACTVLGQIGTAKAKSALIAILMGETEPMVKAEAAYALGIIGSDEKGEAVSAIDWVIEREDSINPDNNFGYAAVLALEKIAEKNGGLKSSTGYSALIKIAQGNYIRTVKDKALQAIREMRKYNK